MSPIFSLSQDAWHAVSWYLEEPELFRLRMAGVRQLFLMQKSAKSFKLENRAHSYSNLGGWIWPINSTLMNRLVDIHIDVGPHNSANHELPPTGYTASSLPTTLVKARFAFTGAPDIFSVSLEQSPIDNIRLLDQCLPNLTDLSIMGPSLHDVWSLPSALRKFRGDGLCWPDKTPFPPEIEILDSETPFWPGDSINNLPKTLKTLRLCGNEIRELPPLPNLTKLISRALDERDIVLPPTLLEMHFTHVYASALVNTKWPPHLHTLVFYHYLPHFETESLPSTLTKWICVTDTNQNMAGVIVSNVDALSAVPKALRTLTLTSSWKSQPALFDHLPPCLTILDMSKTHVAYDQYRQLPITLTTLHVPVLNERNISYIARLVNLKDFGAFGGLISAATIRRLPRGIQALQFHGVAINTYTQARWTRKSKKSDIVSRVATEVPEMMLQVFSQKVMPPTLTKLIVIHHYTHPYYWTHTYEIYKDLPTSLVELHLSFWRNLKSTPTPSIPPFIQLNDPTTQSCDLFSRLTHLESLSFHYPAYSRIQGKHCLPPLPMHGRLRSFYFHYFGDLTDDLVAAIPPRCEFLVDGFHSSQKFSECSEALLKRYQRYCPQPERNHLLFWATVFGETPDF